MSRKIIILLSLFLYNNMAITSLTESHNSTIYQETNTEKENIPLTLAEKVSISDQIYELLEKKYTLQEQLSVANRKIRTKNTLTIGNVIATVTLAGILAGPSLSINYLNQYVTPERYQNFIHKISIGTAGFIGGIGALGLAHQGGRSIYDVFMYEREQNKINQEINTLVDNEKKIDHTINSIQKQYPELLNTPSLDYDQEQIYQAFMKFYNDNKGRLNKDNLNTFFLAHQNYSINNLIDLCKHKKINLVLSATKQSNRFISWFKSTDNLAGDIAAAVLLAPWYLIFSAARGMSKNTQEQITKKELITLNAIIKQLTNLASQ